MEGYSQYIIFALLWIISAVIKHFIKGKQDRDMKELATRLSLDFDDGGMFNQAKVVGMFEGREVQINNFWRGSGRDKKLFYKVQMVHDVPLSDSIRVYNSLSFGPVSGLFSEIGEFFGIHDIQFDNSVFNQKFVVKGKSEKVTKAILDQSAQETMISLSTVNLIIQDTDAVFIEEGNAAENESRVRTTLFLLARLASNVSDVVSTGVMESVDEEEETSREPVPEFAFIQTSNRERSVREPSIDGLRMTSLKADIKPLASDYYPQSATPEAVIRQLKREGYYTGD